MKIRIKSGDCPAYLTLGKVYDAKTITENNLFFFRITTDDGFELIVKLNKCLFLKGGSWEIVND